MRKLFGLVTGFLFAIVVGSTTGSEAQAQQQFDNPDENMKGDDFTRILKDEWSYLKDATDTFLATSAKKTAIRPLAIRRLLISAFVARWRVTAWPLRERNTIRTVHRQV